MGGSIAYIVAIVFIVLVLNIYLMFLRIRRGDRRKRTNRVAPDEKKQAVWRDREIERRIEREQDGALERVKLREETLALYEEVRRRHAYEDELEGRIYGRYEKRPDYEEIVPIVKDLDISEKMESRR